MRRHTIGILAGFLLVGCSNSGAQDADPLVGNWVDRDGQNLSIRADGSALLVYPSANWYSGTWKTVTSSKVEFDFKNLTDGVQGCIYHVNANGSDSSLSVDNCALRHFYTKAK